MSDTSLSALSDDQPFDLEHESLDRPLTWGHDWGSDGSDLTRPVRAHVLAALRPNSEPYPPPVDALLELGDARDTAVGMRRAALGFTQEHLPDLLRLARDRGLYTADSDADKVWAPLHAFRALFDLEVSGVVPELIPLFDLDDDSLSQELPELLGQVGRPAVEPLRAYLADHTRWAFAQSRACDALEQIAKQHPELREQVVAILGDVLRDAEHCQEITVTGAMDALVELEAVEALPLIRRAFELGKIDEMVRGPWGTVLDDLGVDPEDDDPLLVESQRHFEERQERFFPREKREQLQEALARLQEQTERTSDAFARLREMPQQRAPVEASPSAFARLRAMPRQHPPAEASPSAPMPAPRDRPGSAQARARKQKNKRKLESASRKANRKRRK